MLVIIQRNNFYTLFQYLSLNKGKAYMIAKQEGATGIKHKKLFFKYIQL